MDKTATAAATLGDGRGEEEEEEGESVDLITKLKGLVTMIKEEVGGKKAVFAFGSKKEEGEKDDEYEDSLDYIVTTMQDKIESLREELHEEYEKNQLLEQQNQQLYDENKKNRNPFKYLTHKPYEATLLEKIETLEQSESDNIKLLQEEQNITKSMKEEKNDLIMKHNIEINKLQEQINSLQQQLKERTADLSDNANIN